MQSRPWLACLVLVSLALATCGGDGGRRSAADIEPHQDIVHSDGMDLMDVGRQPDVAESDQDGANDGISDLRVDLDGEADSEGPVCMVVEGSPGLSPASGFPLDGWDWTDRRTVLEPPEDTGFGFGYKAPALVEAEGTFHLYYVHYISATEWIIRHATSTDTIDWTDLGPVHGIDDDSGTLAVLFEDDRIKLYHGAGSLSLSESSDGHSFALTAANVFGPGDAGSFDSMSVLYPAVIHTSNNYQLYYTGFNGVAYALGRAVSSDGLLWAREPVDPVVVKGEAGDFDNTGVAQSAVARSAGRYYLWFGGYDTHKTNPGPYRIGFAESSSGINWLKRGISLELTESGQDAYSTRDPAVIKHGRTWFMVYVGMGDDGIYRLRSARSAVCN